MKTLERGMKRRFQMSFVLQVLWVTLFVFQGCRQPPVPPDGSAGVAKEENPLARTESQDVFSPQVAGAFYPADPLELKKMIQEYLDVAKRAGKGVPGDLLGILVPHAGYPYSGPVAAYAFSNVIGKPYRRVVVLAPAHRRGFSTPALLEASAYRTPLGDVPIDRDGVNQLAATGAASVDPSKFQNEHALEVELPFLQVALQNIKLIPVMIGEHDPGAAKKLAEALRLIFDDKNTLFVASTDMSHDYPYDVAVAMDENALRLVRSLDTAGLMAAYQSFVQAGDAIHVGKDGKVSPNCAQFCGMGPVMTLMELAKLYEGKVMVLDRRTSGDVVGDKNSRIVGYSAVAIVLEKDRPEGKGKMKTEDPRGDFLTAEEKKTLLKIARETVETYVKTKEIKEYDPPEKALKEGGAAFVTLKKNEDLRGCIGHMEPTDPLWKMIRDRAIDAAVHDPRFRPVSPDELKDIKIEISVLSPRIPVRDPLKEIVIGRDGVWLEAGMNRGVFLPQVPVEQGWTTVEEYLDHLCHKAGVYSRGCWQSADAKIMRFTALVFSE
jgi:MEMO1 family protein